MKALNTNRVADLDVMGHARAEIIQTTGRSPLKTIWNRRWMVLLTMAICTMAAFGIFLISTPIWVSTAQLYIQENNPHLIDGSASQTNNQNAQKELIASTPVLAIALQDPALIGLRGLRTNKIATLKANLRVEYDKQTEQMKVSYESRFPNEVAPVVDAVTHAYKEYNSEQAPSPVGPSAADLAAKKAAFEKDLAAKTNERIQFQRETGLITPDMDKTNPVTTRLNELGQAITTSHNDTVSAMTNYEDAVRTTSLSPNQLKTLIATNQFEGELVMTTADARQLRDELNMAQQKLAELLERYLDRHPAVIAAKSRVLSLQASYVLALYHRWVDARQKENQLQTSFDEQTKLAVDLNAKVMQYAKINSELQGAQHTLDMLETQMKVVPVNDDPRSVNIRIVEAGSPPALVSPLAPLYLFEGMLVGLILGIGLTQIDGRVRSLDEVTSAVGLPILSVVPHMPRTLSPATRGRKVQLDSTSDVAETYRAVRTAIYLGARGKTVLVTSPTRGDGKSTLAGNLAIAMAEAGQKVLLMDADLREPVQHRIFATSSDTGISSIVAGRASLDRAIQSTQMKGLDLLPCGPVPFNPSETINNQAFADMLADLTTRYDYIVLDAAPVIPVTDARILGAMCDVTIMVVRAEHTTRRAAADARDGLIGFGAHLLGVVINDGPRQHRYGYRGGFGSGRFEGPRNVPTVPKRPIDRPRSSNELVPSGKPRR